MVYTYIRGKERNTISIWGANFINVVLLPIPPLCNLFGEFDALGFKGDWGMIHNRLLTLMANQEISL